MACQFFIPTIGYNGIYIAYTNSIKITNTNANISQLLYNCLKLSINDIRGLLILYISHEDKMYQFQRIGHILVEDNMEEFRSILKLNRNNDSIILREYTIDGIKLCDIIVHPEITSWYQELEASLHLLENRSIQNIRFNN